MKIQSVNWVESELARRPSPKHIDLLPQDQNLGLKRSSRTEKIREHPPDQSAQVQHHATASPDSQSTTSWIWFAVGTGQPIAFAVLRLMTSSNLVGCLTGSGADCIGDSKAG